MPPWPLSRPEMYVTASVQSGWAVGWGIAALIATWFFTVLPQETAWRALFWVGLTPALLVFFVRRYVDEPTVFKQTQEIEKLAKQLKTYARP